MTRRTDEDLFQESTMTFGEHLEELRGALFRAIAGLAIGFLIGCLIASRVVGWIQGPVKDALKEYETKRAVKLLEEEHGTPLPPEVFTMLQSGYVPAESMLIEPFGLLDRLENDFPDQFAFNVTPHKFVPNDLRNDTDSLLGEQDAAKLLAGKLVADQESPQASPGKEIWQRLEDDQREFVDTLAAVESSTPVQQRSLIRLLNDVIEDDTLHQAAPLEKIKSFRELKFLSSITGNNDIEIGVQDLRDKRADRPEEFTADDSRRLNRILIAEYFREYLHTPRRNVVELPTWVPVDKRLQSLRAEETFMIWIKAALLAGAVISSPWIFYQIWQFVAAGLYAHERKYVYLYLPISLALFFAGAALAFYFVFKHVLGFLFTFNAMMDIEPDLRIGEWLGFVLFLPIGFGISFQLPLVMLFLNRIGIFTVQLYLSKWRLAVLVIFVISMLLTPADPVSMLLMAGPLTILYFGGIGMCHWMPKGRTPFDEAYEPS